MSRSQVLLGAGCSGLFIVIVDWLTVWYVISVSFYLWLGIIFLGIALCFTAGLQRSRWFYIPAALGVLVALGVSSGAIFGR